MNKFAAIRCSWPKSFRTHLTLSQRKPRPQFNSREGRGLDIPTKPTQMYPGAPISELLRAHVVYNMLRSDYLVDNSVKFIKRLESVIGWSLTEAILKESVFGQFGGKDTDKELRDKVELYANRQVGIVLAYTAEPFDDNEVILLNQRGMHIAERDSLVLFNAEKLEAKYEKQFGQCLVSIDHAAKYVKGRPQAVAIKLISLVDGNILRRLTTLLNYSDEVFKSYSTTSSSNDIINMSSPNMSFKSQVLHKTVSQLADKSATKGSIDLVDWRNHFSVDNLDQLHLLLEEILPGIERPAPLSHQEHQQVKVLLKRLSDLGERAVAKKVRVLVDAEQTYYQPAIRSLTVHYLMKNFNKEQPTFYDTLQSYLKSSHQTMLLSHLSTKRNNCIYAVKVVRGAYMDEERRLAMEHGCEDPIHSSKAATDVSYHKNMERLMSLNDTFLCVASHNSETIHKAKEKMAAFNVSPRSGQVMFGQLMGMADYISLPLGRDGYLVYKFLHYGQIRGVMPYLIRRGLENRGAMMRADEERRLLKREMRQRILSSFRIV